jgi:hypothetical protein
MAGVFALIEDGGWWREPITPHRCSPISRNCPMRAIGLYQTANEHEAAQQRGSHLGGAAALRA